MAMRLEIIVDGRSAEEAISKAKEWARAEESLRLRTIARVWRHRDRPAHCHEDGKAPTCRLDWWNVIVVAQKVTQEGEGDTE